MSYAENPVRVVLNRRRVEVRRNTPHYREKWLLFQFLPEYSLEYD